MALGGAFHALRPKTIKLPTQSAEKWICMEKWAWENGGIYFSKTSRLQTTGPFYPSAGTTLVLAWKEIIEKALWRAEKKINTVSIFFFAKMTIIWPRTPSVCQSQTSIAPPIVVCWWQMMMRWNHGTKESSFLAFYQGADTITKTIM